MDFGIGFPSYIRAWEDAKRAEDHGFTHAWFYDSQMLYSDVYAAMVLAAEHTRRIKLGTLVAVLGNRIAPVTAHSIATVNELAPGRVILGVGTGFTGRNVIGMPPIPLKTLREHVGVIRELLAGRQALYREGDRQRWIRLLYPNLGFIKLDDHIPIHMASNAPKTLKMVGEIADFDPRSGSARYRRRDFRRPPHGKKPVARADRRIAGDISSGRREGTYSLTLGTL